MSVLAAHFLSRLPIDGQAILLPFHGSCERHEFTNLHGIQLKLNTVDFNSFPSSQGKPIPRWNLWFELKEHQIAPKGVSFSDFICIFAMSFRVLFVFLMQH